MNSLAKCPTILLLAVLIVVAPISRSYPAAPRNSGGAWVFFKNGDPSQNLNALKTRMDYFDDNGSQYVRLWIPWSEVEPSQGNFNFTKFEKLISTIASSGQKLQITLCSVMAPQWYWNSIGQANQLWFWDETTNQRRPATDLYPFDPKKVNSPHISIWGPSTAGTPKNYIKKFVNKTFQLLLDKWAPSIVYVNLSLGRFNEPTYTDPDHFWCYDDRAIADHMALFGTSPPTPPFTTLTPQQKANFFNWYRDSKRNWIIEANQWVDSHLQSWQRNIVIPAGGSGDTQYDDVTYCQTGCGTSSTNNYLQKASSSTPWTQLCGRIRATIMHMQDNFWLISQSKAQNPDWYAQFAGINGNNSCGVNGSCPALDMGNPVCKALTQYSASINYSSPLYGQIASLTDDDGNIDCTQPAEAANEVIDYNYYGFHWNKDENLFDGSGIGSVTPNCRFNNLVTGWTNIESAKGGDYNDPVVSNVSVNSSATSSTITWTTNEASDSIVLYGTSNTSPPDPNNNYLNNLASNMQSVTSHSITFNTTDGTTYYYVATSTDGNGNTTATNVTSFVAGGGGGGGTVPGVPVLVSPPNNVWTLKTPLFDWNAVTATPAVDDYKIEIRRVSNNAVVHTAQTGTTSQYQMPNGILLDAVDYKWRVQAHNSVGWGALSAYFNFTVRLTVDVDMGLTDVPNGLQRPNPEPADGETIGQTITSCSGNVPVRKNRGLSGTTGSSDRYIYVKVDDNFILNNSHPTVDISVQYWNHTQAGWASSFCLEYKLQNGNIASQCQTVTADDCMKNKVFQLTNAYFGNGMNGGSDFRIWSGGQVGNANEDTRRFIDWIVVTKK